MLSVFRVQRIIWLIGASSVMACSGEKVLENTNNSPPAITILSHVNGFEALEGYSQSFRATVSDDDSEYSSLEVAWFVGEENVCDWTYVTAAGESYCDVIFDLDDSNIIAQARDDRGGASMAELSVVVLPTEVPTVSIEEPTGLSQYYSDQLITFRALVADVEDDVQELTTTWSSSLDGELSLDGTAGSDGIVEDATTLQAGAHFVEVTVTDTTGKSSTDSITIDVQGPNSVPTCEIMNPLTGDVAVQGSSVVFSGQAGDVDIPVTDLSFDWLSDKDGLLGTGAIDSQGEITFAHQGLSVNTHTISLEVRDEVGATCSDTILLTVDTPPAITLNAPLTGDVATVGQSQFFSAVVSDNEDPASSLTVEWTDSLDGLIYSGAPDSTGLVEFYDSLSAGNHNLQVVVQDSSGLTATASRSFLVNSEPQVDSLTMTPVVPVTSDTLLTSVSTSDPENHSVSTAYAWYKNGDYGTVLHTASTLPNTLTAKNETWSVRVTPNDGYVDGPWVEASVDIVNSAPQITSTSVTPTLPLGNDVLTCTVFVTDADGETPTETYSWQNLTTGQQLGSGSTLNLAAVALVGNDSIQCSVTVTDGDGATDSDQTTVIVQNTPPIVSNVQVTPSNPLNDETLVCSASVTDPEGDPVTTSYQWEDANGTVLGSGTSLDLTQTSVLPTDIVTCVVTSVDTSNAMGTGQANVTIANRSPVLTQVAIVPTPSYNDSTLTCSAVATDLDGQTLSTSYVWQDGSGTLVASIDTLDLTTLSGVQPASTWTCIVTVNDGVTVVSDTVSTTLDNRLPTVSSVGITPNPASISDVLTCTGTATDPDGGTVGLNYEWDIASNVVGTGTTLSYSFSRGDVVTCTVTPDDANGVQWGQGPSNSSTLTIGNTAPQITSLTLSPTTVDVTTPVVATALTSDADGDVVTVSYVWYVASSVVTGQTTDTLDPAYFSRGDTIMVEATPNDGFDDGAMVSVNLSGTVQNTDPTSPVVTITPNGAIESDGLVCEITTPSVDADGDSIVYNISWMLQGGSYQGVVLTTNEIGDTIPAGQTLDGEVYTCLVSAYDGIASSATASDVITILPPFNGTGNWSASSASNPNPAVYLNGLYDQDNHRVLTMSGQSYYRLVEELQSYDISAETWSTIVPSGISPAALLASSGAFDTATSRYYLFGGQSYYTLLDEFFVLDTTFGAEHWEMWTGSIAPEPRRGHSVVFDDLNNDLYVFGGEGYYGLYDDMWLLDLDTATASAASWTSVSTGGTSPMRLGMASAMDPDYGLIYAFGGQEYYALSDSTQCFDVATQTWSEATLTGDSLPAFTEASVSWNSRFHGFLLVGGQQYYQLNSSVYAVIPTGACTAEVTEVVINSGVTDPVKGALLVDNPVDQTMLLLGGQSYYQLSDWISIFSL